jgi:hypothetical protein
MQQPLPAPVAEWLKANHATNTFAQSLNAQYARKGMLTGPQIAAVENNIAKRAASAAREASAPVAVIARIEEAFARATESGLIAPKLVIGSLHFSPAKVTGRNPGAIYAKDRDEGTYLGKFAQGRFVRSADCTDEKQATLLSIAADPLAAAVNHGKLTGRCSVCVRKLTDKVSVARGIGPICAEKFGW